MKFEITREIESGTGVSLQNMITMLIDEGYHILKQTDISIQFEDYDKNSSKSQSKISDLYKAESGKIEFIDPNELKLSYTISILGNLAAFIVTLVVGVSVYPGFFFFSFIILALLAFKIVNVRSNMKDLFFKSF